MMTSTALQLYYSAEHWQRMGEAQKQYHEQLNDHWSEPLDTCSDEFKRGCEVLSSSSQRRDYFGLQAQRMRTRPLIINGICFGRLLDDARKDLHRSIDEKFAKDRAQCESYDKLRDNIRSLTDAMKDIMKVNQPVWDVFGEIIKANEEFYRRMNRPESIYGPGHIVKMDHSKDAIAYVTTKGHEVTVPPGGKNWEKRRDFVAGHFKNIYYAADGEISGIRPAGCTVMLKSGRREFFCTTHAQWKKRRTEILPPIGGKVTINGIVWTRVE